MCSPTACEVFNSQHGPAPTSKTPPRSDGAPAHQRRGKCSAETVRRSRARVSAKLLKTNIAGEAVIALTVSPNGRVLDPQIKRATDPAFGEAALAAARLWRFLPKVETGRAVATTVEMPFQFFAGKIGEA